MMRIRPSSWRVLLTGGTILLIVMLFVARERRFLEVLRPHQKSWPEHDAAPQIGESRIAPSPESAAEPSGQTDAFHFDEKASEQFGAALQRAGIETQSAAAH